MILKIKSTHIFKTLKEFIEIFNATQFISDNIDRLSEEFDNDEDVAYHLIKEFFTEKHGTYNISIIKGVICVIEFDLSHVVVHKTKCIPCNTRKDAEDVYMDIAKQMLSGDEMFKAYKGDIDFNVIQRFINSNNLRLYIHGK